MEENKETVVQSNVEPVDQMAELKKAAIEQINKSEGFILFCFEQKDVELQGGQKIKTPKNSLGQNGVIGGGAVALAFVAKKSNELLASENAARNEQNARLAE